MEPRIRIRQNIFPNPERYIIGTMVTSQSETRKGKVPVSEAATWYFAPHGALPTQKNSVPDQEQHF